MEYDFLDGKDGVGGSECYREPAVSVDLIEVGEEFLSFFQKEKKREKDQKAVAVIHDGQIVLLASNSNVVHFVKGDGWKG
ncbi:hypothetical protein F0562_015475 [Nyssa sinensis]|uniref:Uncharacterized protein n=1 Tax=Nyssa sinensis TaxID=561372 RepID=A0A5J4ZLN7_9ASTE|nr:hypothetical protein F0562_015475 [Nyssa sinensis]